DVSELSLDALRLHLAVEHPGDALRRAHGVRLRGSVRTSRARRRARRERVCHLDGHHHLVAAGGPEHRRIEVLWRLPAEASAEARPGAHAPAAGYGTAPGQD